MHLLFSLPELLRELEFFSLSRRGKTPSFLPCLVPDNVRHLGFTECPGFSDRIGGLTNPSFSPSMHAYLPLGKGPYPLRILDLHLKVAIEPAPTLSADMISNIFLGEKKAGQMCLVINLRVLKNLVR